MIEAKGIIHTLRRSMGLDVNKYFKETARSSIQDHFYCELKKPQARKCLNCETNHNHNNAFCSAKCCKGYKSLNTKIKG